ncbi:flagellar motor switch protein FliM [Spirochaeta isovalerica]|uniref:Flagellar motor switch protein FliM n=1 Tax=Spirochaeta isovalerica TaxID=150 RepID=A0A841R736_9SPIO|nr:flagellar motor switch protein FliM [Spirochaeta isovalerica]MBB6479655.1 flagellar motor switch protein FliM/flagellar motor switch protein FliG [Spirochaeta isovalerica]
MEEEFKVENVHGSAIMASARKENREYRVKKYDFKRPDKFSLEQIRTLSIVHESFCRLVTVSLSGKIRKKIDLSVAQVDQLAYFEFIDSIPDPTAIAVVNMHPLRGSAIIQIDPDISFPLCDLLFGGSGMESVENRELSPMERSVSSSIADVLLKDLAVSWEPLIHLEPEVGQIETNPQMAMIVPPTEMVVLVSLKVVLEGHEGRINFCIPFLTIEPLIEKLSAQYWFSRVRNEREDCVPSENIISLKLDCEVLTEAEDLSLRQIGQLRKGSLVRLPLFGEGHSYLRAGGETVMDLTHKKIRSAMKFQVAESRLRDSGVVPGFLNVNQKADSFNEDSIKSLAEEMKKLSRTLTEKIDRLSLNQEQLSDQVFFSTEGDQPAALQKREPFGFIGLPDIPLLYELLSGENKQAVALILSRLDSGLGAELLGHFPKELQPDIIKRIGTMDRVSPEIINKVEKVLLGSFNKIAESSEPDVKGVEKVTQILSLSPRSVESHIIGSLDKSDSHFSEEIKKRMFVFEDIVLLDSRAVARLAQRVDLKDLCLAMKMVAEDSVREHIFTSIPPAEADELKKCLEEKGRVLITEVDKAQQRIVSVIRQMEEEGEMLIGRADEMID